MSIAALEAEVARLQAENGHLRRALADVSERIVAGRLTGELPDKFFELFSQLPDRPLEKVLRFLPARQVVQMRHVSRRFNDLIKKSSKIMPKKGGDGTVVFKSRHPGELTLEWIHDCGNNTVKTKSAGDPVVLSELLRFVCIDGPVFFGEGLSAADGVLDQLSKPWLTIRPEMLVFSGDYSQTSADCLKAFLMKVMPFVKRLQIQNAANISNRLADEILLSMANGEKMPAHFFALCCSGFTPDALRELIQKWASFKWSCFWKLTENKTSKGGPKSVGFRNGWELSYLTFYNCANMTPAAVGAACGDLLKKERIAKSDMSLDGDDEETNDTVCFTISCHESQRHIRILFDFKHSPFISDPTVASVPCNDIDDDNAIDYDEYDGEDHQGEDAEFD